MTKQIEPRVITVSAEHNGARLDQFLTELYPGRTRSYFSRLIKHRHISVDEQTVKSGYSLKTAQKISVYFPEEKSDLLPADIPLDIVYEDDDVLVINKPAGIAVHPGKGSQGDTLVNALLHYTRQLSQEGSSERPGIVHRLDKYTSGLLVVAKNDQAHYHLRQQFDTKSIKRIYQALVWGKVDPAEGTVHTFINRSRRDPTKMAVSKSGKEAITHYSVIKDYLYATLLEVKLETGRTHQIRVHMNHLHHQVVGDSDYAGRETQLKRLPPNLQKRGVHLLKILTHQALHAKQLSFIHPSKNEMVVFETELPAEFQEALDKIEHIFLLD